VDLFTRCPDCATVFRVTTRHLQASGGQVRCGRCKTIFDGFASLTAKPPGPGERDQPHAPDTELPAIDDRPAVAALPPSPVGSSGEETRRETPRENARVAGDDIASAAIGPDTEDPAADLYEWEFKTAPGDPHRGLWLTLSLVLALVATVQAGYLFRTPVMVNIPQAKTVYDQACQWLSCEIGLPQLVEQLNIDASDLQLVNPDQPGLVELSALVRNRAVVPVEYPALELTLTNAKEQVIARRVLLPDEYLQEPVSIDAGFPAGGEVAVRLFLDTGSLRAAGYRIYLFYPA
jgi:predicted Zn finger-like uncharacterized protein